MATSPLADRNKADGQGLKAKSKIPLIRFVVIMDAILAKPLHFYLQKAEMWLQDFLGVVIASSSPLNLKDYNFQMEEDCRLEV